MYNIFGHKNTTFEFSRPFEVSWAVSRSLSFLIFEFHDSPRFVKTGIISLTLIQSGHKMGTSIIYLHKIRCSALI